MKRRRHSWQSSRLIGLVTAALTFAAVPASASYPSLSRPAASFPSGGLLVLGCEECVAGEGLFTVTSDGRGFRFLKGTAGAIAPRWSPDGRRLVFTTSAGTWLSRADGSQRRLVARWGGSAAWSPKGDRLVFLRKGGLYTLSLATLRPRRIVRLAYPDWFADPDWSPDGKTIVGWRGHDVTHLWLVDADGSNLRRLGPRSLEGQQPRWSPDGRRLAYVDFGAGAVKVLTLRTGGIRTVFAGAIEGDQSWALAWSPDGRWLAVAGWIQYGVDEGCEQPEEVGPCQEAGLWIVNATDGRSKRILGFPDNYAFLSGLDWKAAAT